MSTTINTGTWLGFDTVELDSPHNRNALSIDLLTALLDAVRSSADGRGRGLLFTHTGPAFCAGVDLKERRAADRADTRHSTLLSQLLHELWHYPRPVVALVDGAVRGGGLGLVACADIVVATARSTFAYSEARVGVAPALVMAVTVPVSGSRRLMPHLLGAEPFNAETAHELGLVSSVVADRDDTAVEDILTALRRGAPGAQATVKQLARAWTPVDVDRLIDEMTTLSAELFATEEATEGMAAFAERRAPRWAAGDAGQSSSER